MKVIEFAGMPGSGKTTIARRVHHNLQHQAVHLAPLPSSDDARELFAPHSHCPQLRVLEGIIKSAAYRPGFTLATYRAVTGTVGPRLRSLSRAVNIAAWDALIDKHRGEGYDAFLVAGGPLLWLWLAVDGKPMPVHLTTNVFKSRNRKENRLVVFIDTPAGVCDQRISERDHTSRFDSNAARMTMLQQGEQSMKELLRLAAAFGYGSVLTVDGSDSVEETAGLISQEVLSFIN